MTTMMFSSLPTSRVKLASGALGTVYRLDGFTLPGFIGPVAYKEFHTPPQDPADVTALRALIEVRQNFEPAERAALDGQFAWPLGAVQDDRTQATLGLLMPLLPDRFVIERTRHGRTSRKDAQLDLLFCDADKTIRGGAPCPGNDDRLTRLRMCQSLAHALALLHRHGLVYGDFSHKNALYALSPDPTIFLIDCDAIRPASAQTHQANTFSWFPPEVAQGAEQQNSATDCYKLALFILRCLAPGGSGPQKKDPDEIGSALDSQGRDLLHRALGADPLARPSSGDWVDYLFDVIDVLVSPPTVDEFSLDDRVILSGAEVTATWRVRNADGATLTWPDGFEAVIEGDTGFGSMARPVCEEGFLTLRCTNKYGERRITSPMILIVQLPRLLKVSVPEPAGAGLNGVHGGGRGVPPPWTTIRLPDIRDFRSMPRPQVPALVPVPRLPPVPDRSAPVVTVPPLLIQFGRYDMRVDRQHRRKPSHAAVAWLRRLVDHQLEGDFE
jgi:hypothetical protein